MRAGEIDAIAFTSKSQVERLRKLARRSGLEHALDTALAEMTVAAIGPVVAEQLRGVGVQVDVMPRKAYFMKPLATELTRTLAGNSHRFSWRGRRGRNRESGTISSGIRPLSAWMG